MKSWLRLFEGTTFCLFCIFTEKNFLHTYAETELINYKKGEQTLDYFVYDGTSIKTLLPDSELMLASLDKIEEIDGNFGREIIKGEVNSERYSPNYITSLFNENVNFDVFIYKKNQTAFTEEEQRKLTKLLTNARTPKWMSTYDCNDNLITNYRGLFTQVTYKVFNKLMGVAVHFENDSPYDYDIVKDKSIALNGFIYINSDSDEKIYPTIKVTGMTGSTFTITEGSKDDQDTISMTLYGVGSPLYIDCKRCMIYYKQGGVTRVCDYKTLNANPEDLHWFCLSDGKNYFKCTSGETDIWENVTFDYIVPQKRAIRW